MVAHIVNWSGGKDSTATVILMKEHLEELVQNGDKVIILTSEVMFDLKNNVSGVNPDIITFITGARKIFEKWGFDVHILRSDKDYLDFFHHTMKRSKKNPEHEGMKFGFPIPGLCGVKRDLKIKPIAKWIKENIKKKNIPFIEYEGIAVDEPVRLLSMKKRNTKSLLEKYNYTESMARQLCEKYGLLSPQYQLADGSQKRDGCWMCPWAKAAECKNIKEKYPKAWQQFVDLENEENVCYSKWNPITKKTLHDIDDEIEHSSPCKYHQYSFFEL